MRVVDTSQGLFNVGVPEGYTEFDREDNVDWIDFQLATKGGFSPIHTWVVDEFITEDSVVVDVGAHIGTFTVPAAKKAKIVHSFEPVIQSFLRLTEHIEMNNLSNVTPHNFALGDSLTSAEIDYMPMFNTGAAKLTISRGALIFHDLGDEHAPPKYRMLVKTLDSLDLPALDFLKCDTEGCELLVVRGAIETIKKFRPVMVMEHNYIGEIDEVLKVLADAGVPYGCTTIQDPSMGSDEPHTDYLYEPS